jgi:ribonuclease T2
MVRFATALAVTLSFATPALAQVCAIPGNIETPAPVPIPPGEVNASKANGYLLALSWSPQFCRGKENDPAQSNQCGGAQFGFILHGLWPDGPMRNDPAWCAPAKLISKPLARQHFCMTPSPQLLQHEWAKHGTCMADSPEKYLQAASLLYGAIKYPDMTRLAQSPLNVGAFKSFFVRANPGLRPDMLSVQTANDGWLREVRVCLDLQLKPRSCPAEDRGARAKVRLRIYPLGT